MPRVLLLLATTSYRAEDFLEAARRLGLDVVVGSDHRQAVAGLVPGATLEVDFGDVEESARRIVAFHREWPLDAVVAAEDEGAELAARAAEVLALPRANPPAAVRAARHKDEMRRVLAAAGVPVPEHRVLSVGDDAAAIARALERGPHATNVAWGVGYPVVLKPVFLSASRGVIRADDPAAFVAAFRRVARILEAPDVRARDAEAARRVLVERYVPGEEVALEGLLAGGGLHVLAVMDKPDPLEGPFFEETIYVTPSRLPQAVQRALADCTARAARALGLKDGPVHAELRYNDQGPWLIEVAPRAIGGKCSRILRFGAGVTLEELILRHALGLGGPPPGRSSGASGVMMIPIPAAGVLRAVRGLGAARAMAGIEDVDIAIPIGGEVVPLPEGNRYLGFIVARADSPAAVEAALRESHGKLEFELGW